MKRSETMMTNVRRKNLETMLKLNASTANQWPMSEAEVLKKALAKIKREEKKGLYFDDQESFLAHVDQTISTIVNERMKQ